MGAVTSSSPEVATRATRGVEPRTAASGAPVESDLGWALGVVFRRYAKAAAAALDDVPGGPRGYQVLATAHAEGPRRQLDLAAQLGVDRTVMTYLLDDLEKAGLVQRNADPADRRARLVSVTPAGIELVNRVQDGLQAAEAEVLGSLPEQDRAVFRAMLQRVVDADPASQATDRCTVVEEVKDELANSDEA
jgi:DNA-binding MarR family transcriptional regulator